MAYLMRIVILVFVISIVESSGGKCDCPTFWTAFGNNCYRYFGQRVNLKQARQNCRIHGSHGKFAYLASIHSQEEQNYLDALVKSYNDYTEGTNWHVWIGLHDEQEEGKFVWTDNSNVDFTYWALGQPHGATVEQGVVMFYPSPTHDGLWHDDSTTRRYKYVCMMPRCSL